MRDGEEDLVEAHHKAEVHHLVGDIIKDEDHHLVEDMAKDEAVVRHLLHHHKVGCETVHNNLLHRHNNSKVGREIIPSILRHSCTENNQWNDLKCSE